MPEALRAIQHRDADLLPLHFTVVIDPIRALAPDGLLAFRARGIHHAGGRRIEILDQADAECSFFGIAESQRAVRGVDGKFTVDDARMFVATEREGLRLFTNHAAVWILESELGANLGGIAAARFVDLLHHHMAITLLAMVV